MKVLFSKNLSVFSLFCIRRKTKPPKATVLCENNSAVLHMEAWEELLRVRQCHCDLFLWLCDRAFPVGKGSRGYKVIPCKPGKGFFPIDVVVYWLGLGMLFWQILSLLAGRLLTAQDTMCRTPAISNSTVEWSWVSLCLTSLRPQSFLFLFGSASKYLA